VKKILVFVPSYNCQNQIVKTIVNIETYFSKYLDQILIVDNGSTDATVKIAHNYLKTSRLKNYKILLNKKNYSLGGSHKVAFNYMIDNKFDYLVTIHGDNQGDIKNLINIFKNLEYVKYDCMFGARFHPKSKLINYSKLRIIGNIFFNIIFSILLRSKIYDIGAGLNIYSRKFLENKIYLNFPNSMMFNPYLHFYSYIAKSKILFFPIDWKEEDQISNVSFFKDTLKLCKIILILLFNKKSLTKKKFEKKIQYAYNEINE
jgi:glycosyltransferase involved in cell wall biosynthesis